jgi:glucose-6-phosphate isomerase
LDDYRRKNDSSDLGKILNLASRLRDEVDRVVLLGAGGNTLIARALFQALKPFYHNELPTESRLGVPRMYFEGDHTDNDSLQDLLDLLQVACVEPERREERWAAVVLSHSGATLEPLLGLRILRREAQEYYGLRSKYLTTLFAAATGPTGKLREQCQAYGIDPVLTLPPGIGSRFGVFSAVGLLPAALMGLDVRALLLGAAAMTKRFLEEPFERNPVLQLTAINYLMTQENQKPVRVLGLWSKKLEALGAWYGFLLAESLGKQGQGATLLPLIFPRDLHGHAQLLHDGPRDRFLTQVVVKNPRSVPIGVQMADQNHDDLNALSRKSLADLTNAAHLGLHTAMFNAARPSANLILPSLTEHTVGQLLQMLLLATTVEARLLGINPYGQPGSLACHRYIREKLNT